MLNKVDDTGCPFSFELARKRITRWIEKITPTAIVAMLMLFVVATISFLRRNAYFWFDDFVHFIDARTKTLLGMMASRVDVHFAPFHQLLSFSPFKFYGLNFDASLGMMAAFWTATIASTYCLLRQLSSNKIAGIITLLFGASPLWFHTLVWWSGAAHRLPYLLLQTSAFLAYLRYRENGKNSDFFSVC